MFIISFPDLVKHFTELNINGITPPSAAQVTYNDDTDYNSEINRPFTLEEIKKIIHKLESNKACGVDSILNEFMKYCPISCIHVLCDLFNIVLNSGMVPTNWCMGIILPLYKNKGSPTNPDNYRGITLLSCVSKLFTACINSRLALFIDDGILGNEQAGFREGYSTTDHVYVLYSVIEMYLSVRKRVYCAFIDYKKAFDTIQRELLWQKLLSSGIHCKIFTVIRNLYSQAKSCVRKGNFLSDYFVCNIGVRQGENLSPLLFSLFINDFSSFISNHI